MLNPHFSGTPIYSPISCKIFCLAILGLPDDHPLRLELLTYMLVQLPLEGPFKSIGVATHRRVFFHLNPYTFLLTRAKVFKSIATGVWEEWMAASIHDRV